MRPSISIRGFVRPSVGRSVGRSVTLQLKTQETRIYNAAVVIECVWVYISVWEGGWGEAGGWLPLPTRPQRYCDPASLVTFDLILLDCAQSIYYQNTLLICDYLVVAFAKS